MTPILLLMSAMAAYDAPPVRPVPSVDLTRYAGRWYEIARFPNWFQRKCAGDTTATYALRPDGKIDVLNECRQADGKLTSAKGTARLADPKGPKSKLKVTFFWPFSGDYWIIELDPEYQYAVVGHPGRNYLWILCRRPQMDESRYSELVEKIAAQGYDVKRIVRTLQPVGEAGK
jgi:apolipoprotein D and lipocalin family protein